MLDELSAVIRLRPRLPRRATWRREDFPLRACLLALPFERDAADLPFLPFAVAGKAKIEVTRTIERTDVRSRVSLCVSNKNHLRVQISGVNFIVRQLTAPGQHCCTKVPDCQGLRYGLLNETKIRGY